MRESDWSSDVALPIFLSIPSICLKAKEAPSRSNISMLYQSITSVSSSAPLVNSP
jgi:hypothetical protein